jgi:hypothetical protein
MTQYHQDAGKFVGGNYRDWTLDEVAKTGSECNDRREALIAVLVEVEKHKDEELTPLHSEMVEEARRLLASWVNSCMEASPVSAKTQDEFHQRIDKQAARIDEQREKFPDRFPKSD